MEREDANCWHLDLFQGLSNGRFSSRGSTSRPDTMRRGHSVTYSGHWRGVECHVTLRYVRWSLRLE